MKFSIGHSAVYKMTNEQGLILGAINVNNTGWKVQFSLDSKIQIVRTGLTELEIGSVKSTTEILDRLLRDITSKNVETRKWASENLCSFIEVDGPYMELDKLQTAINSIVERITMEDNWEVGQKLGEGIYEFVCLQKIDKEAEFELIKKLASSDKDYLKSYLKDEEYLEIKEVRDFINDKSKWWNTGS